MKIWLLKGNAALDWINELEKENANELFKKIEDAKAVNTRLMSFRPLYLDKGDIRFDVFAFNAFKDLDDMVIICHAFPDTPEGERGMILRSAELFKLALDGTPC